DGGCGAAAALGVEFLDQADRAFVPVGGTLHRIARIRTDGLMPRLREAEVIAMCDIDNPLCGENGAAAVFGPQKGADAQAVRLLDDGLRHLAEVIERDLGGDLLALPGGGAAGGFGAGSAAFLGAKLQMGIETVLELVNFDRLAADADLVITGEGRLDSQSLRGKVVIGVARRAKRLGVPVAALVGSCELPVAAVYEAGVSGIFPIHPQLMPLSEAMAHTREHLAFTAGNMLRFAAAVRKNR
ncbi:MAG TPA: glycerate kinase, partial [Oscillibacter sp.]|nr:glycerate kinase [Oscillibacter sp.]